MDLLAGYGSDASSDHDEQPAAAASASPQDAQLGQLPPPRRSRKPAQFKVPIPVIADSDDEDDMPKKKAKLDTRGKRLGDVLPAPKNGGATLGALGAGSTRRKMSATDGGDSDDDFKDAPPTGDGVLGGREAYAGGGDTNEAFRVDNDPLPGPASAAGNGQNGSANLAPGHNGHHAAAYGQQRQQQQQAQPAYDGHAQQAPGERLLEEAMAMAADAKGAARRSAKDPFADLGVKFVEVDQKKLKYVNPMAKAEANAARSAFGADYEARLRQEAGPAPEKLARRKHQISSLYHQAKMKELELLETRTAGMKTKAETQAKYGW